MYPSVADQQAPNTRDSLSTCSTTAWMAGRSGMTIAVALLLPLVRKVTCYSVSARIVELAMSIRFMYLPALARFRSWPSARRPGWSGQ